MRFPPSVFRALFCGIGSGIAAEDPHGIGNFSQFVQSAYQLFIGDMAQHVNEEEILPVLFLGRTAFNHGQCDIFIFEGEERIVQGADTVLDGKTDGGLVRTGGFGNGVGTGNHQETRGIVGVVLNIRAEDIESVDLGGEGCSNSGGAVFP